MSWLDLLKRRADVNQAIYIVQGILTVLTALKAFLG